MTHWSQRLLNVNSNKACEEAVAWCATQPSLAVAWEKCDNPSWMFWLIGRTTQSEAWSDERKPLVRAAVECAMLAPPCDEDYELARIWCLDASARWCAGEADRKEVEAARYAATAAYAAAYAADAAAYAYVSAAAAYASASAASAYAAADAADAAAYAADAAADAAYADARKRVREVSCVIIRKHFVEPSW